MKTEQEIELRESICNIMLQSPNGWYSPGYVAEQLGSVTLPIIQMMEVMAKEGILGMDDDGQETAYKLHLCLSCHKWKEEGDEVYQPTGEGWCSLYHRHTSKKDYCKGPEFAQSPDQETQSDPRPTWDEYFFKIAEDVSSRSACFRNHCGAVIVMDKYIVSTGYNGSPQYQPNCQEIGYCFRDRKGIKSGTQLEQCRAVGSHAESNAIALAARNGGRTQGATIYVVGHSFICHQCKGIIANAGIAKVFLKKKENGEVVEIIPERDWTIHPIDD